MGDRFKSEDNKAENEDVIPEGRGKNDDLSEQGTPIKENGDRTEKETSLEESRGLIEKETSMKENKELSEKEKSMKENGALPEKETIPSGEVDERISSYVKEHIRNGGRRRKISAFRVLFFVVLITIVVFFFVDYVLMKRQAVNGWFSQSGTAGEDESGETEDGEEGNAASEDTMESAAGHAQDDVIGGTDSEATDGTDSEMQPDAANSEGADGNIGKGETNPDENQSETDSSGEVESETAEDPVETATQYLVYIEVTDSEESVSAQADDMEEQRKTTGVIVEIGQSAVRILTDYASVEYAGVIEITLNGGATVSAQVEKADLNTGLALLVVSVADLSNETLKEIRMATWGDTTEIGAGTDLLLATATEQTVDPDETGENTGNAGSENLTISGSGDATVSGSGDTTVTGSGDTTVSGNGDTTVSGNGDTTVAGSGDTTGSGNGDATGSENENTTARGDTDIPGSDEDSDSKISLTKITVLAVGEKKQPDTVFTTYSFDANTEGCRILVDENGDIVAIGTDAADSMAGYTETADGTANAIAYCADDIRGYIEKMVDGGEIPYVGITGVAVTDEIKEGVSLDMPYGVYVWLAATGSPAYQAGILNGDIITAINGVEITTVQEMRDAILELEVGAEASFTLMRQGGSTYREYTIKVTPEASGITFDLEITN